MSLSPTPLYPPCPFIFRTYVQWPAPLPPLKLLRLFLSFQSLCDYQIWSLSSQEKNHMIFASFYQFLVHFQSSLYTLKQDAGVWTLLTGLVFLGDHRAANSTSEVRHSGVGPLICLGRKKRRPQENTPLRL